jgi:polar amino acid transport system substrate-binding protein
MIIRIILSAVLYTAGALSVSAQPLKVSLAQMPVYAESTDKGVLVDMSKAIAGAAGRTLELQVVPFKRSLDNVITKKVDFHAPLIVNPTLNESDLDYDHSTITIFHVNFVLYSNPTKQLDMDNPGEYSLETDAAHVQYFPFKIAASSDLEASLKKVDAGRIDGFIFADMASDPLVTQLGLNNIKRSLYKRFDVKIILPKGGKGGATDKLITSAVAKLKADGKWDPIMSVLDQPYKD